MSIKNLNGAVDTAFNSATQSEYIRLRHRTARSCGGTCYVAIPNECIGRAYNRYIHPDTGAIVLTPVGEDAE